MENKIREAYYLADDYPQWNINDAATTEHTPTHAKKHVNISPINLTMLPPPAAVQKCRCRTL